MQPLAGTKVLDFTSFLSGPYCTMMLADMGAEVIKIERPGQGEVYRTYGPKFINGESTSFLAVNRNKKSLTLDLKKTASKLILERLIAEADILVENMKPGAMEKIGLGYDVASKINSKLIYCSISGYGASGPYRERGGFDLVAQAMSGLMSVTGERGGNPVKVGFPVADMLAGVYGSLGILAAYAVVQKTGKGQFVDTSLLDAGISLALLAVTNYYVDGEIPTRMGSASPQNAPYQGFATSDGYITVGTGNDVLWERFCHIFELEFLLEDPRFVTNALRVKNQRELADLIQPQLKTLTAAECLRRLQEAGIPCGPIYDLAQMLVDLHVQARQKVIEVPHTRGGCFKTLGLPFILSEQEVTYNPPPALGEHNEEILLKIGFSREDIRSFKEGGLF